MKFVERIRQKQEVAMPTSTLAHEGGGKENKNAFAIRSMTRYCILRHEIAFERCWLDKNYNRFSFAWKFFDFRNHISIVDHWKHFYSLDSGQQCGHWKNENEPHDDRSNGHFTRFRAKNRKYALPFSPLEKKKTIKPYNGAWFTVSSPAFFLCFYFSLLLFAGHTTNLESISLSDSRFSILLFIYVSLARPTPFVIADYGWFAAWRFLFFSSLFFSLLLMYVFLLLLLLLVIEQWNEVLEQIAMCIDEVNRFIRFAFAFLPKKKVNTVAYQWKKLFSSA